MSLIKFSSTDDFHSDVIPCAIVTDPRDIIKRAGSERFAHVKVAKNQTPVHIIALSAGESTGANRNSDWFGEEDCRDRHHTFVKAGRAIHHNHKNKPSDPKYGDIYASDYNEPMRRVELLIGLDNDAPKNADTLQKLAEGKQVSGSMAAKIPYDVCSVCSHKAPSADKRCKHIPSQLGEITKEGKQVNMLNVEPDWFEYSIVKRGADRVAYSINSKHQKQASASEYAQESYLEHAKLAQEIHLPSYLTISKFASSKRETLNKLSAMEKRVNAISAGKVVDSKDKYIKEEASKLNSAPSLSKETIKELREFDPKQLMKALVDKGVILNPDEFMDYLFEDKLDSKDREDMKSHLPHAFENFPDEELHDETFEPSEHSIPSEISELIKGLVGDHSLSSAPAKVRIMKITIMRTPRKELKKESSVSDNKYGKLLAEKYSSYKLSALNYLNDNDMLDEDLLINSVVQNFK